MLISGVDPTSFSPVIISVGMSKFEKSKTYLSASVKSLLDIKVNNDSPEPVTGSDEPGIKTNEIVTKLLVSDGDIVVIGGIKKNTLNEENSKTPGASKIPVLGNLFKSKTKTDNLVELLIFISPRVID